MPRLTAEQWEQARADYEVKGLSLGEIGRKYGASQTAISKQARKLGWQQGKSWETVNKKVQAVKVFAEAEKEKLGQPQTCQDEMDSLYDEMLQQEGILASLSNAIARKASGMLHAVDTIDELEKLSRVKKNLTPPAASTTQVTVQQAQGQQSSVNGMSPDEVCDQLIAEQNEEIAKSRGKATKSRG